MQTADIANRLGTIRRLISHDTIEKGPFAALDATVARLAELEKEIYLSSVSCSVLEHLINSGNAAPAMRNNLDQSQERTWQSDLLEDR